MASPHRWLSVINSWGILYLRLGNCAQHFGHHHTELPWSLCTPPSVLHVTYLTYDPSQVQRAVHLVIEGGGQVASCGTAHMKAIVVTKV